MKNKYVTAKIIFFCVITVLFLPILLLCSFLKYKGSVQGNIEDIFFYFFIFAFVVFYAFTLFRKVEEFLNKYSGNLNRTVAEVAKIYQSGNGIAKLDAVLIIASKDAMFLIMGDGNVVSPTVDYVSIGSGSNFALGAADALYNNTNLSAKEIVEKSLKVASEYCIYTNDRYHIEEVE